MPHTSITPWQVKAYKTRDAAKCKTRLFAPGPCMTRSSARPPRLHSACTYPHFRNTLLAAPEQRSSLTAVLPHFSSELADGAGVRR